MKCPYCGAEIERVNMYAEGRQSGYLEDIKDRPGCEWISNYGDQTLEADEWELECPECYENLNVFVAEDYNRESSVTPDEAPKVIEALAKIKKAIRRQESDVLKGNDGAFVYVRLWSSEKDALCVKVEFGVNGNCRKVEYTTWWTIDRKTFEIKENKS